MRQRAAGVGAAALLIWAAASCSDSPAAPKAMSVAVTPSSVTLVSIGETASFSAAITDQYGKAFTGAVAWSSSRLAVFTVTTGGLVTAVANGSGVLTASFEGLSATATVTVAQVTSAVEVVSGGGQAVRQGLALGEAVVVQVNDARGSPVEGVSVAFAPDDGDGSADPDTVATAADGRARTSWTLGNHPGAQSLTAAVAGAGGPSARIAATALAPEETADSVRIVAGDQQRARQGLGLQDSVVALVLDADGEPVPGARVAFTPAQGDGAADPDTVATDADGRARTSWTLGNHPGTQSLTVAVAIAGGPSARVAATALTPEETADSVRIVAGDRQRSLQGTALQEPVVALVLDADGEPVPGARVAFTPAQDDGSADPDTVATDADGRARTSWTLGDHPGAQSLTAALAIADGPSARVAATALTPEETANSIRIVAGDRQRSLQGTALQEPVVALVLDATGEPVPGARVTFTPAQDDGAADPDTVATDADGRARTSWTLDDHPGTQSLTAAVAVADGPFVRVTATALAPEETVAAIRVVSGDRQRALQGTALQEPVVALVLDATGEPVPGARVAFTPAQDDGAADPDTVATDADGRARTSWTLDDHPGAQSLTAAVAIADGPFVRVTATALTPEETASSIRIVAGDRQRALQGTALQEPVVALVLDATGEPVPGTRVAFTPAQGDGAADPDTVATDADGRARTSWTLGDHPGAQSLTAAVAIADGPSARVAATALTPEETANSIRIVAGDRQRALQGTALQEPVVALVLDATGEPVPGARVTFTPAQGDGAADPDTVATDADGRARTSWTLDDHPGAQSLTAAVAIADGPFVRVTATALTPEETANSIRIVAGDRQRALQGTALQEPVVALVLDATGEPVPGARVAFTPAQGDGAADPDTVATDADGRARTSWTLGDHPGAQSLTAAVAIADGPSARVAATALTPEETANSIRIVAGDRQRALQGTALQEPVVALVLDADGEPVSSARVAFTPAQDDGSADPDTAATDADGRARTSWTLGDHPGAQSLTAAVAVADGPFVRVTATALAPEETVAAIRVVSGDRQRGVRGRPLSDAVVVELLDTGGNPVANAEVSFTTASGNGSANPSAATADAQGRAQTSWTLGEPLGTQRLTAAVAGGPAVEATATAIRRPVNRPPVVSEAIPMLILQVGGATVEVRGSSHFRDWDGDVLQYAATSSDDGSARVSVQGDRIAIQPVSPGTVRVFVAAADPSGATASQTFRVTVLAAPDNTSYNIDFIDLSNPAHGLPSTVFRSGLRWEKAIVGDLPNIVFSGQTYDACGQRFSIFAELDDLAVFVYTADIDGQGKIAARAGSCLERDGGFGLSVFGVIEFDPADLGDFIDDDLDALMLHEVGHVLGVGTLWQSMGFLQNPSSENDPTDTHFTGPAARAAFDAAGGTSYTAGAKVPVHNLGGAGTINVHWRASVFNGELMDPYLYIGGTNPLSEVTIQSLADLGYTVDASEADAWSWPDRSFDVAAAIRRGEAISLENDVVQTPILVVDAVGRVVRVIRH